MDSRKLRLAISIGGCREGGAVFDYRMISNSTFIKFHGIL